MCTLCIWDMAARKLQTVFHVTSELDLSGSAVQRLYFTMAHMRGMES